MARQLSEATCRDGDSPGCAVLRTLEASIVMVRWQSTSEDATWLGLRAAESHWSRCLTLNGQLMPSTLALQ